MAGFQKSSVDPQLWIPNKESASVGGGLYSIQGLEPAAAGLYAFEAVGNVIVTPFPDMKPCPRIKVEINDVPDGYTLTLYRIWDKFKSVVRDAQRTFAGGGFTAFDYEAPRGVTVTYRAELFDADGASQGFSDSASTLLEGSKSTAIFQDPLDPANAIEVTLSDSFGGVLTQGRSGQLYQLTSGRVVSLLGMMGKLTGVDLSAQTHTLDDAERFRDVLNVGNVLVRTVRAGHLLPRLLYVTVGATSAVPQDLQNGGEWVKWPITGNEIDSPDLGIVVPVITWQTYIDTFPTWNDFNAAYLTWNDAIRNPPEA